MAPVVSEMQTPVPPSELAILEAHLPFSYSLLRRCQFTHRPQGTSEHAHYLFASDDTGLSTNDTPTINSNHGVPNPPRHFAAAYVDLSKGPETEVILYSTLQDHWADGDGSSSISISILDDDNNNNDGGAENNASLVPTLSSLPNEEVDHVLDLLISLLRRIKAIAAAAADTAARRSRPPPLYTLHRPHGTMVGGLHEGTYQLLVTRRGVRSSYWNPHDVWLFRLDRLPAISTAHPPPPPPPPAAAAAAAAAAATAAKTTSSDAPLLRWDVVRRKDVPLIASRTKIPKVEATLMSEPSVVVREGGEAEEGTLVAWGFMGIAGTLSTLHVEEPYRGRGMAKAVAVKVLKEHSFGDDGWGSADVHVDNIQSQGVCKSLGGKKGIRTCWTVIDYDSIP